MVEGQPDNCPRGKLPLTPKLTLSQTLTPTGGQFSSGPIVWLPLNHKTNPNLDPNPNPKREAIFRGGKLFGYRFKPQFLLFPLIEILLNFAEAFILHWLL